MNYWLIKSDFDAYPWSMLIKEKQTVWDGVRNFQARNNLEKMKLNDLALFYQSGKDKEIKGICRIVEEHYPDPTSTDMRWIVVDVAFVKSLEKSVSLDTIKKDPILSGLPLIRQQRLSVMPITLEEFNRILALSNTSIN